MGSCVQLLGEKHVAGVVEDGDGERIGTVHPCGDEGGRAIGTGERREGKRAERRERLQETPSVSRHRAN